MDTASAPPQYLTMGLKAATASRELVRISATPTLMGLAIAAAVLGATVALAQLLRGELPEQSLMLLFLLAVLGVSISQGFWTGLVAAVAAFAAFNYFFVEPLYTLQVDSPQDALGLGVLLAAGAATGLLAGRMHDEAAAAMARADMLEQIAAFSEALGSSRTSDDVKRLLLEHLAVAGGDALLLETRDGRLSLVMSHRANLTLTPSEQDFAERASRRRTDEPRGRSNEDESQFDFTPFGTQGDVIGYRPQLGQSDRDLPTQFRKTIVRQSLLALERLALAEDAKRAADLAMQESIRSALLSSLSHDLRTPLATILGGATSLKELGEAMPQSARAELLGAIEEEAKRLSAYVGNLLDMTRLKSGVTVKLVPTDLREVLWSAATRIRRAYPGRTVHVSAGASAAIVNADAVLLEQAVFNLVDNAVKFSPAHEPVSLVITKQADDVVLAIADRGSGINPRDIDRIFDPFYRSEWTTARGTGLGLTISRLIAELHHGTVTVQSPGPDGVGSIFRLTLAVLEERRS